MTLVALIIGLVIVVAAIRNSQNALFEALATDAPGFVVWAAAIFFVGALGFIPALKTPSRALLALVILVIVMNNYQAVLAGLQAAAQPGAGASSGSSPIASGSAATPAASNAASSSPLSLSQLTSSVQSLAGSTTASDAVASFTG